MPKAKVIAKILAAKFGKASPLAVTFEITHLCNLACVYCDRHTPLPNEMTRDEIFSVFEQFIALGMWKMNLDGGEPLAHSHAVEMVDWLTDRGISTRMNTNGILVPKKVETVKKLDVVKISLDGPRESHDSVRGEGSFDKAIRGAEVAREVGVPKVEFTCVVGQHNADQIETLIDMVEELGLSIIFQPLRNSLFQGTDRDGAEFQLQQQQLMRAFARIEERKREGGPIANEWSSLHHFRTFPEDTSLPCSAGWISVTMDPEGNLYHCGQINRSDKSCNVVKIGVKEAFDRMPRYGCSQCWCARTVEGNYKWGGRLDKKMPLRRNEALV